nr:MAG TPA: Protealysin propeptide [Caudoviricetes sp.]
MNTTYRGVQIIPPYMLTILVSNHFSTSVDFMDKFRL